jgi:hypothetical protein
VLSGSTYSIFQKLQNETKGVSVAFDHPYIQSFLCCIGEMLAFVVYFIKKRYYKNRERESNDSTNLLVKKLKNQDHLQSIDETVTTGE